MKPIREQDQVDHYGALVREMMLTEPGRESEFNPDWLRGHQWKVVPVESGWRLPEEFIPRLVSLLRSAGYLSCVAVYNEPGYIQNLPAIVQSEPPRDMATCYLVEVDEADFREYNQEFGPFRSVLTTEDRFWSLSTHEWYSLFAGKPSTIEAIIGEPIEAARKEFQKYAALLARGHNPDRTILQLAEHYAGL